MGPRSPEAKLAKKLEEGLNVFDFNEGFFAYMLNRTSTKVQARVFRIFMHMIRLWSLDLENGTFDTNNYNDVVNAKRIKDHMETWGYVFEE